jgi:integrase
MSSRYNESQPPDMPVYIDPNIPAGTETALSVRHRQYLNSATAENTRTTYRSAVRQFERWGGKLPTDRDMIIRYLLDHAETRNVRTLDLHLTALSQWHRYQAFADPTQDHTVRKTLNGMRRLHGKPKKKAKALRLEHIARILGWLRQQPDGLKKTRDLALVQIGFFGAFRRSELVAIRVEDLVWDQDGLIVRLSRSKTDQQGEGLERVIPAGVGSICAVQALWEWVAAAELTSGPVFRPINRWGQIQNRALRPAAINDLLKSLGEDCGFDFASELSSHSFRRGLSTSAAREHLDFELIKKQGGWKNDATVREYIDEGRRFEDNVVTVLIAELERLVDKPLP